MSETDASLVEIVEDEQRARTYWKRPVGEERPQEPRVVVPVDLLAELLAYAARSSWVASNTTCQEARDLLRSVDSNGESYVCMPCREMVPDRAGEIVVPGGTKGTVWCPWCGDKMEQYEEEIHG